MTQPTETVFYVAPYEAKQLYLLEHACEGRKFDKTLSPITEMYNEYFGGGMNSVVFQEMRERRSLAYSAYAGAIEPSRIDRPNRYFAYIATQNDKLADAVAGFNTIINDMPTSQTAFDIAKTALDSRLRSERIIKDNVAWYYINCQDLNISEPSQRALFEALPTMTLDQVVDFQQKYVKGRKYAVGILGDSNDIDLDYLRANGKLVMLTLEDIFGY
jgi:predicted Zn-dependent peptidase